MFLQLATTLIVFTLVQGQPQYEIQVGLPIGLLSYQNSVGRHNQLANGACCSPIEIPPNCTMTCTDIHISLCLRETVNDTNVNSNDTACTLGEMTFSLPTNTNTYIVFEATEGATTTTYPGSFQVHFVITASNLTKILDSGMTVLDISVGSDRELVSLFGSIALFRVFDIAVACKEGYFGPDCGSLCTPRDDSTGHFTCDENGAIVCLPGYQNTATNCVEEVAVTTDVNPSPESTTAQGGQAAVAVVPMVVGGAVGGIILLLFIIVGLIAVIALARKSRKREIERPKGDAIVFKALSARLSDSQRSDEDLVESSVATTPAYTKVNRGDQSTQQEEAPPIVPYRGDPYTEVARTGLFATSNTATREQIRDLPELVVANSPAYAEIRQPQIVYTDVALSKVRSVSEAQLITPSEEEADNTTVQYSQVHVQY